MSVVVIGGNDRMASRYKDICESYRCKAMIRGEIRDGFFRSLKKIIKNWKTGRSFTCFFR